MLEAVYICRVAASAVMEMTAAQGARKPFCFVTRQCEHLADAIIWSPVERGYNAFESLGHGCDLSKMAGSRIVLRLKVILPIL